MLLVAEAHSEQSSSKTVSFQPNFLLPPTQRSAHFVSILGRLKSFLLHPLQSRFTVVVLGSRPILETAGKRTDLPRSWLEQSLL